MSRRKSHTASPDRLTVTLAPGQKKKLQELAKQNGTTLAFIVRYALNEFLGRAQDRQLTFDFRLPPKGRF